MNMDFILDEEGPERFLYFCLFLEIFLNKLIFHLIKSVIDFIKAALCLSFTVLRKCCVITKQCGILVRSNDSVVSEEA